MCYRKAAELLSKDDEDIACVKVFSAIAEHIPASAARHEIYNAALRASGCQVILGNFLWKPVTCRSATCGYHWRQYEEKETDVNIALHILNDASRGAVDVIYIVTRDSDIAPAAIMVKRFYPNVELVTVTIEPYGHQRRIRNHCHRAETLTGEMMLNSLLPAEIESKGRIVARRPVEYDPPR